MQMSAPRCRVFLVALLALAMLAGMFFLNSPLGRCSWFFVKGVLGPAGEATPPLAGNCVFTNEKPSDALLRALDEEQRRRGLVFEKMVSCRLPPGAGPAFQPERDRRWLPSYVCCTWQYRRHVVVEPPARVPEAEPGVFVAYTCLVPRWKYARQIGGKYDHRFEAWK
jgi:hypothetical protein